MIVPDYMLDQVEANGQIGELAGASGLAIPARDAANHLGGWLTDGMHYVSQTDTPRTGTGRISISRYPNVENLLFWVHVATAGGGKAAMNIRAGTGVISAIDVSDIAPQSLFAVAPWGAADSGSQEVYWQCLNCYIDAITIMNIPRGSLSETGGDDCIERGDPTYLQGGLDEGRFIMSNGGNDYHVSGIVETVEDAYVNFKSTAIAGSMMSGSATLAGGGAGSWGPVGNIGPFWAHRARTWRFGDASQSYRCRVRSYRSAGAGNYYWRFRGSNVPSTVTTGALTDAAGTWRELTSLLIDCTADDKIVFEAAADVGTTITVTDLTVEIE